MVAFEDVWLMKYDLMAGYGKITLGSWQRPKSQKSWSTINYTIQSYYKKDKWV